MTTPDSVVAAYVAVAVKMHGEAGADIDDTVSGPDDAEQIGVSERGDVWRLTDGWGEYYFYDPPRGPAVYVCCKMPDVMAVDVAKEFSDKIKVKELAMTDKAWDDAVLAALDGGR